MTKLLYTDDFYCLARLIATNFRRYIAVRLYNYVPIETSEIIGAFAAITKKGRLFIHDVFRKFFDERHLAFVLLHETYHDLFNHFDRKVSNLAADLAVNSLLLHELKKVSSSNVANPRIPLPEPPDLKRTAEFMKYVKPDDEYLEIFRRLGINPPKYGILEPSIFGFPELLSAEEYDKLLQKKYKKNYSGLIVYIEAHGNSLSGGKLKIDEDDFADFPQIAPLVNTATKIDALKKMYEHFKSIGTCPAELKRLIDEIEGRAHLSIAKLIAGIVSTAIGGHISTEQTYFKKNRRWPHRPLLPRWIAKYPKLGIVLDTSGSISDAELKEMLVELKHVISHIGSVYVVCCDWSPYKIGLVSSILQVKDRLVGGGGTNMYAGLEALAAYKPDLAIVFTDGYSVWSKSNSFNVIDNKPKGLKDVLIVLINNDQVQTPPWARTIRLHQQKI